MKNSIFLSFILDEEVEVEVIMSFLKLVAWGTEIVNFWHRIISISNVNVFVEFTFIFLFYCLPIHKENRCLTRYCPSANQPTGHQMNRQGLHVPKNIFWAKFGRFWAKNPNFYQRKKKFWYSHNVALFIGRAWHQMRQKRQDLAQNDHKCIFLGLICFFGPKILIFFGRKQKF